MSILRFLAASLLGVGAHAISIATFHDDEDTEKLQDICRSLAKGSCIALGNPDEGGLAFITLDDAGVEGLNDYLENQGDMRDTVKMEPTQEFKVLNLDTEPKLPWGLDRIDQQTVAKGMDRQGWTRGGKYLPGRKLDGEGVHVYVVDTGIRTTHKEFGGRAVPTIDTTSGKVEVCASDDIDCARDKHGHGTHVAGTVGGKGVGVAPGATLHAVKVLEQRSGETHNLMPAFDWIMRNAEKPAVIQMSLGSVGKKMSSPALDYAITQASSEGILTVVAAGNGRADACMGFPAHVKAAMTVAASSTKDRISKFSNYGECVDIFAPGEMIQSASHRTDLGLTPMSGTSMAAPHVSGAAAMVLQEHPKMDAADVAKMLEKVATADELDLGGKTGPNLLLYVGSDAADPGSGRRRRTRRRRNRRRETTQPPTTTTTTTATQAPLVPRRRRIAPGGSLEDRVTRLESLAKTQAGQIASLVNRLDKCKGCSAPTEPTRRRRNKAAEGNKRQRRRSKSSRRRQATTTTTTTSMEDLFRPE